MRTVPVHYEMKPAIHLYENLFVPVFQKACVRTGIIYYSLGHLKKYLQEPQSHLSWEYEITKMFSTLSLSVTLYKTMTFLL